MSEYIVDFLQMIQICKTQQCRFAFPFPVHPEYLFHESSAVQTAGERVRLRDEVQHLIFFLYFLNQLLLLFPHEHLFSGELIQSEHISDLPADEIEQNGVGRIDLCDQYAILHFTGEEAEHFSAVGIRWMPVI